jgi:hypothetical protein
MGALDGAIEGSIEGAIEGSIEGDIEGSDPRRHTTARRGAVPPLVHSGEALASMG